MTGPRRSEGAVRDDGDPLLGQQPLGERLVGQAGVGDPREDVEHAAWLERPEADRVEAVDEEPPLPVVLGEHPLDVRLAADDRLERRVLGGRRGGHDPVRR